MKEGGRAEHGVSEGGKGRIGGRKGREGGIERGGGIKGMRGRECWGIEGWKGRIE